MSDTISKFYIHRGSTSSNLSLYQDNISGDQSSWVDPSPLSGTNWYKLYGITMTGQIIDSGLPTPVSRGFPSGPQWATQLYFPDPSPSQGYTDFYSGLQVNGSVLDSAGNLYVCGHGNPYGSGINPLYVAKYSPSGALVWQKYMLGSQNKSECTDIIIDKDGNILITGWCCGTVTFDPSHIKSCYLFGSVFILKLSPTAGNYIWSTTFNGDAAGSVGDQGGFGIATDNSGKIWIVGTFVGNMTVAHSDFPGATGSVALTPVGGQDIFIAKFDTDGSVLWAKKFGSAFTEEHGNGIAVDPATGASFITGTFNGTVDFSQGTGTPLTSNSGQRAPFVAKFDTSGASLASIAFQVTGSGSTGTDGPTGGRKCRLDSTGSLVVGGVFKNATITIGGTTLNNKGTDTIDIFITKLNGSTLNPSWASSYGSNTADNIFGLAIAPNGNIVFTGLFWRTMDVGSFPLTAIGYTDIYIAMLSPAGVAISAINYGSAGQVAQGTTLAISPSGPVYIGLLFGGPITFSTTVSLPTPTPSNRVNGAILATVL